MRKLFSSFKLFFVLSISLLLISCGGGSNLDASEILPADAEGRMLEEFAPEGSNFVMVYSMQDEDQRTRTEAFVDRFSFGDSGSFYDDLLAEAFPGEDLVFEEDIRPMFGDDYRMLAAANLDFSEDPRNAHGVIELYGEDEPSMVIAMTLSDVDKAYDLFEAFAKKEEWLKGNFEGKPILANAESGTQMMIVDSFMLVANSQEEIKDALDRYNSDMLSLADNDEYLEAFSEFEEPQMFTLYINMAGEAVGPSVTAFGFQSGVDFYQIYGARAEEDGFSLNGLARFDKDMLKDMDISFKDFKGNGAYLSDKLKTVGGFMMYSESYNIAQGLKAGPLLEDPSLSDGFEAFFGSTLEEGLLSWLDRGFAMAAYSGDSLFPGVTFVIDANSNVDAAKEFYFKLDGQLAGVTAMAQAQGIQVEKRSEGDLTILSIDLNALPDMDLMMAMLPEGFELPRIDISYGLTVDGYFVLSVAKEFYEKYTAQSGDNLSYDAAMDMLGDTDGGVTYIGFDPINQYLGFLRNFVGQIYEAQAKAISIEVIDGESDEAQEEVNNLYMQTKVNFETKMDKVIDFLDEFEYLVIGNEINGSHEVRSKGYLKLR